MKALLIIVGAASVGYGAYLIHKRKSGMPAAAILAGTTATAAPAQRVTSGPTMHSTAGPVDNGVSPVQHYSTDYTNWFPPITYIEIPGAGSLDQVSSENMHQIVHF